MNYDELKKIKKIMDLRNIAKGLNIPSPYKYKKDELIELIVKSDKKNGKIEDGGKLKKMKKIDISDINIEDLSDKATEEIEQLEDINMAEGILEIHMDGYGF